MLSRSRRGCPTLLASDTFPGVGSAPCSWFDDFLVRTRPTVTHEAPPSLYVFTQLQVAGDGQDLLLRVCAREHLAELVAHEGTAPESHVLLRADPVHSGDDDAVGDGVPPLYRLPGVPPAPLYLLYPLHRADG